MTPWTRDQFESQLERFPEGQICVAIDGLVVASASSLIVDFDTHSEWHDWRKISDGGYIRNHDPEGDALYGIEIMVDPAYRGLRLARRLPIGRSGPLTSIWASIIPQFPWLIPAEALRSTVDWG